VAKGISHVYSLETNDNGTSTINEDVFASENGPTSTLLLLLLFPASSAAAKLCLLLFSIPLLCYSALLLLLSDFLPLPVVRFRSKGILLEYLLSDW